MGLFDTVWVKCPTCGEENGFQSKSGECILGNYSLDNCPYDVLFDINRHAPIECECGTQYEIDIKSKTIVITKPPTMNQTDKPTGVPEDVKQKIRDRYPYYLLTSDTVGSLGSSNDSLEPFREAAAYGYSLALPELTAKEEEIKGKNNTISIMNKVINSQIEFIKELKEENAKLKEEVERLKKDVIDVLSENHQAQIAGYYNDDKTDAEREKRNAVIEEYSDLLIIFKARFNSPTTKK